MDEKLRNNGDWVFFIRLSERASKARRTQPAAFFAPRPWVRRRFRAIGSVGSVGSVGSSPRAMFE
jgi:hypothetical protein